MQNWEFSGIGKTLRVNNGYLFLAVLAISLWVFGANVGVFLDDVYIYLRVVSNAAKGMGPVLNPGDSHFAVTSPLWTFLLSWASKVFGFLDLVTLSKLAYMIFLSIAATFAFLALRKHAGSWAILAPLPVVFGFVTCTSAGGEIALAYCALLGTLWAYYVRRHIVITGLFSGLAYLARSELVLVLIPIGIHYLFVCTKEGRTLRSIAAEVGQATAVFLAVVLVWHIYYATQFHALFPGTLRAKIVQGKSGLWPLYSMNVLANLRTALGGKYYLVPFLVFGLIYFRGVSLSLLLYAILHCLAYTLLSVPNYHWYYYDLHLLISTFTVFGLVAVFLFLRERLGFRSRFKSTVITRSVMSLALFLAVGAVLLTTTALTDISEYGSSEQLVAYSRAAEWMKPRIKAGDVVLAPEIGILGYLLEDAVIRDTNGVASPDTNLENINKLEYFVSTYTPRFIVFPDAEQPPHKAFLFNGDLALYKKDYVAYPTGHRKASVFSPDPDFPDIWPVSPPWLPHADSLSSFLELSVNAILSPDVRLVVLDNTYVLYAHSPFASRIKVPEGTSGLSVTFGYLPSLFQQQNDAATTDGATFEISGVKAGSRTLLLKRVLLPSVVEDHRKEQTALIEFLPGEFESLELSVEPGESNAYDWTYWGDVRFQRAQQP